METERQREWEHRHSTRTGRQQEYIREMLDSVEENLKNTGEEQRQNEEFENRMRAKVYQMYGITEDKLQGMAERRRAWYQGAAFALFFLSLVLVGICGFLHGPGSEICIFMAFYTAVEGTLLSNGREGAPGFRLLLRVLYLFLYPVMLSVFLCYELSYSQYEWLTPIATAAGVVVLMLGAASYFAYDPYRADRRTRKAAERYLKNVEKKALKEVRREEKEQQKQELREKKTEEKERKREQKAGERQRKREERAEIRLNKRQKRKEWCNEVLHKVKKKGTEPAEVQLAEETVAKDMQPQRGEETPAENMKTQREEETPVEDTQPQRAGEVSTGEFEEPEKGE